MCQNGNSFIYSKTVLENLCSFLFFLSYNHCWALFILTNELRVIFGSSNQVSDLCLCLVFNLCHLYLKKKKIRKKVKEQKNVDIHLKDTVNLVKVFPCNSALNFGFSCYRIRADIYIYVCVYVCLCVYIYIWN